MATDMKTYTLYGRVVLPHSVVDRGAVVVKDGVIVYAGEAGGAPAGDYGETFNYGDNYIAPGFVDIHCHAGGSVWAYESPTEMAKYHLAHGTTSILCTFYRDFTHEELMGHINRVKSEMSTCPIIKGVHLEGPYLNPQYGASTLDECEKVDKKNYMEIASTGIIKQWTFAPEVEGTDGFLKDIVPFGIAPAIGHSCAAPSQVYAAAKGGTKIVTHLFDATGTTPEGDFYDGTIDVSFDMAALLCDDLLYEIICDENGVHVRGDLVRLAVKTVGHERIIAVTDACTGDDSDTDINVIDGELYGSKLTMDGAARNLHALGFDLPEVFMMTSTTPAKAISLEKTGKIESSYKADLLILDKDLNLKEVITSY